MKNGRRQKKKRVKGRENVRVKRRRGAERR